MRGKKAKAIRRQVYGDMSSNAASRRYRTLSKVKRWLGWGQIEADPKRREYQKAKGRRG